MSLEENKAVVRRWVEELNRRNLDILDELTAPNFFQSTHQLRGLEEYKQFITMMFDAFPDWHEAIDEIMAEGDRVWHRFKFTGTHSGEFRGLIPTGNKLAWTGVSFWRIVDGKVVEKESIYDMIDAFQKLDVIEYKGFPDEHTMI